MEVIEIILGIVQILTLLAVVWYTWETHKLRKGQDEILMQNIESLEPNVIMSFEEGERFNEIYIEIENTGKRTAHNVKFQISPEFDAKHFVFNKFVKHSGILSKGLQIIKGGKKIRILAGSTLSMSKHYKESELHLEYTFRVEYNDINNEKFAKEYDDSLAKFFVKLHTDPKTHEAIELGKIGNTLKEISAKLPDRTEDEE